MIWLLALSSLRLRPLRTFLTTLGIAVAVASTVIFLSLGEGFREVFSRQLGSVGPDLQVSYGPFNATASFTSVPELSLSFVAALEAEANIYGIKGITPVPFHLRGGFTPASSFVFQGIPPEVSVADIYFDYEVTSGRDLNAQDSEAFVAVVGTQTSLRSGLELGESLRLNPEAQFEIVGIAKSAGGLIDNAILVPLKPLQRAIGIEDRVTFLALDLAEAGRAAEIAEELGQTYPELGFQTKAEVLSVVESKSV